MEPSPKKNFDATICAALAIVTLIAFWGVHGHDFVNYDDQSYITNNPFVNRGLTRSGLTAAFTDMDLGIWHPLTWVSLMIDAELYGMNAGGYHVTSLLLHIANTLLLYVLLKRMTKAHWPSAFVAILFAIHPLHVEPVAWASSRKDVLSTCFLLTTLLTYHWYVQKRGLLRNLAVALPYGLGLLAKPMLVTVPCVLLLLDYWPWGRGRHPPPPPPARARPGG